jgi:hypothetical protein
LYNANRAKCPPTTEEFYDCLQNSYLVAASSTGRCNAIQSVDPTVFPLENRSVRLYSIDGYSTAEQIEGGRLRLYTAKTGVYIHCPLPSAAMKALKAIPKDEPYSLWSGNGTAKDRKGNWRALKRLSELFEVPESLKRLRRNVKELLEFLSGGGLKGGYIAAKPGNSQSVSRTAKTSHACPAAAATAI